MNACLDVLAMTGPIRGRLRQNVPLARYTTWRVGGPARRLFEPADVEDLAGFLAGLPEEEPLLWLGLGSNLLVRDGGVPGTVVLTTGLLRGLERRGPQGLRVEAGVACAKVARFGARAGLRGAGFLAGIPGTMGGALAMNAGAFEGETWRLVERVEVLDREGRFHLREAGEYRVGYRSVQGPPGEWFLAAHLGLEGGDDEGEAERIRALLKRRGETQPIGVASCGSVFRNPPGDHAARLIEACGLKGLRIGGAEVSRKHANFIINTGGATAADIESLMEKVSERVLVEQGVRLVAEVRIVGVPGEARS